MAWSDIFKLWKYSFEDDPITRQFRSRTIEGAGVADAQAIPDLRSDGGYLSANRGNIVRLRDSTDFIDLSSVTNRQSRYKEYERLRSVAEVETALTVFADESCVTGDTLIATPFGYVTIKELVEQKSPDEEFLVYCYDFNKEDYSLGWAYHPRFVKRAETIKFVLDTGVHFSCTPDHRVLLRSGEWIEAGDLTLDHELMPFYRLRADSELTKQKRNQFARVYTLKDSWKTERQFIDEWRHHKKTPKQERLSKIVRLIESGLSTNQICNVIKLKWPSLSGNLKYHGFSYSELHLLKRKHPDRRRILNIIDNGVQDVYDLSVRDHENFATNATIMHNCQIGENGHLFKIDCKEKDIKEELEFLFFHPSMLNMDRKMYNIAKNLYLRGDHFLELIIDPDEPKAGILKIQTLPADSVYRIETIKSKLLEFQQSKEGPDYQSLSRVEVTKATPADLAQATAIRFTPSQIVHLRIGEDRQMYYPYGVSLIDAARGPAHNLRLMEDAMLTYRLTRAPERRIFYIDVGGLPPFKAEAFMDRIRDTLRKKKTFNSRGGASGASPVEEKWNTPSFDEDFFIPIRPNTNTRIETLPGAQNLGEVDDALYFRNKLFIALNFPKNYMAQEDAQITKVTISSVDVKFARLIERLQMSLSDGLTEIAIRHLSLRGFPSNLYEDLQIRLTPPSHWRELSENEVIQVRFDRAMAMKGSMLFADLDIMTRILQIPEEDAKEIVARSTAQQIQQMKLQIVAQNPQLLGVAYQQPSGQEMGTTPEGPNPNLGQEQGQEQLPGTLPAPGPGQEQPQQNFMSDGKDVNDTYGKPEAPQGQKLPEPDEQDIQRYDLDINDFSKDIDEEEISELELDE